MIQKFSSRKRAVPLSRPSKRSRGPSFDIVDHLPHFAPSRVRCAFCSSKKCWKLNLRTLYNMSHCTLSSKRPQLLLTILYKTMIRSYISQVQFHISVTSSYSTWLFMNICTAIYFMYFYLRHHVTKINVIKANLNVIQNFFILLSIYEKLPLRTRGTSVSRNFPGNWQQLWKNFNYSFL